MRVPTVLLLFVAAVVGIKFVPDESLPPVGDEAVVQTAQGAVMGVVTDDTRKFLGIPFAAPPVDGLRFEPPAPASSWAPKTLSAKEYAAGCPQHCELPPNTCPPSISEDCLYLNVYTPRLAKLNQSRPVIIWIPGGRFEQGSAGVDLYDSSTLVQSDVVVVTVSYRLGALGFLFTGPGAVEGNFGILDQRLAMQWVQANIGAFGGDPSQVTLAGQSAGGTSTTSHLVAPGSWPLFHRAIIQSNPFTLALRTQSQAEAIASDFCKALGCSINDVACMRNHTWEDVVKADLSVQQKLRLKKSLVIFYPWTPVPDGTVIPMEPMDALEKGKFNKVPVVLGSVANETLLFIYQASAKPLSSTIYELVLIDIFGGNAVPIRSMYPPHHWAKNDTRDALAFLGTHYIFNCITRKVARLLVAHGAPVVHLYWFDHVMSFGPSAWGPDYAYCDDVVCHGSELPFEFNTAKLGGFNFTAEEKVLSDTVIAYWTNFASTGSPNKGPATPPFWPAYNEASDQNVNLATPVSVGSHLYKDYCDEWDKIGYNHGI